MTDTIKHNGQQNCWSRCWFIFSYLVQPQINQASYFTLDKSCDWLKLDTSADAKNNKNNKKKKNKHKNNNKNKNKNNNNYKL